MDLFIALANRMELTDPYTGSRSKLFRSWSSRHSNKFKLEVKIVVKLLVKLVVSQVELGIGGLTGRIQRRSNKGC